MIFFLKVIFEGIVHIAIGAIAAPCYLYIIIFISFEYLQISF